MLLRRILINNWYNCQNLSKIDIKCEENDMEHRLTKTPTPKTSGMVKRLNGIIKNGTILKKRI